MSQRKPEKMTDDALFADWASWIERVGDELIELHWNRKMYRDVSKVFEYNPHLQEVGTFVYDWLKMNYIAGATMSFRREVDRARHMGFVHLLAEITARPSVLSRRRHHEKWGNLDDKFEDVFRRRSFEAMPFVKHSDDEMLDHIDPNAVQADIDTLRADTEIAQNYVEQTIAHRTRGEPETITFVQFNAAVDALTPIFQKYYARLTGSSMMQLEPVPQYNTHLPFTFPWDITCDGIWQAHRGDQRLPWNEIRAAYEKKTKTEGN
jgi:hypothetical protein